MNLGTTDIKAENIACARGGAQVFTGVSFRLSSGDLMVVRGQNGSGKSSLLRILAGLMKPAGGSLTFSQAQRRLEPDEAVRHIHLVGHRGAITDALTTEENLRFQTVLLGGPEAGIGSALARFGLAAVAGQRAQTLSAGQRRRLALTRLLTAPRPVWLLDEPSEALDATGEALVQSLITEQRASGGIVVLATHEPVPLAADIELTLIAAESVAA